MISGLRCIVALMVCAPTLSAQDARTITGSVYDSIGHAPLRGAVVQVVSADASSRASLTATADSSGRYVVRQVPAGNYRMTFFHPMLDSLGIEAPLRSVNVGAADTAHLDLAIPGATQLRRAICGTTDTPSAMALGVVRDAESRMPLRSVSVVAGWSDMIITKTTTSLQPQRALVRSADNGWFAVCNLPAHAELRLIAVNGGDSSSVLPLTLPGEGLLRQDIYMTAGARDRERVLMKGVVRTSADGRPVADARIAIAGSGETRTNDEGEWKLNAVLGTRVLEVRALGFYPNAKPVAVIDDAPVVNTRLSTLRQILDTIRVVAKSKDLIGFESRRERGGGRYLDARQIAALRPIVATDVFLRMINVRTVKSQGSTFLVMRGRSRSCSPVIFVDGVVMPPGVELDDFVIAKEIRAVEVYDYQMGPADYIEATNMNCGTILIWTRYAIR